MMMMGGQGGMGQMNPLMLSMLLDDSVDMKALDKTKLEKVCSDAGVDCAADLAKIFNSIEGKQIDCAAAADETPTLRWLVWRETGPRAGGSSTTRTRPSSPGSMKRTSSGSSPWRMAVMLELFLIASPEVSKPSGTL